MPPPGIDACYSVFGESHLQLPNVVSARIGDGIRTLPSIKGYVRSVTVFWRPKSTYTRLVETESDNDTLGAIPLHKECEECKQVRVIQLLSTDDTSALADMEQGRLHEDHHPQTQALQESDRLSTIPEGTEETTSTRDSLDT